jgi:hypothetical protein
MIRNVRVEVDAKNTGRCLESEAARLLDAWEAGRVLPPAARALVLLSWGWPDATAGDLANLSVGARDKALLTLHARRFGSRLECLADCPACGESLELAFDAQEIGGGPDLYALIPGNRPSTLCLGRDGWELTYRTPSAGDLAAIDPTRGAVEARSALRNACLLDARGPDGSPTPPDSLPAAVLDEWEQTLMEADPDAETRLDLSCPACGHRFAALFDATAHVWSALDATARRLLREVHRLAGAYGWSESEILALGPARRRAYLQLLG